MVNIINIQSVDFAMTQYSKDILFLIFICNYMTCIVFKCRMRMQMKNLCPHLGQIIKSILFYSLYLHSFTYLLHTEAAARQLVLHCGVK